MSISLFLQLEQLRQTDPLLSGVVAQVHADGTATVTLPGAGQMRVRNPLASAQGAFVYLQGGAISGAAPALEVIDVFI
jgi:hypothetical protein